MGQMCFILLQTTGGEAIFIFLIAVALAYGVGCLGKSRKIGFGWAFVFALVNVLLGLIIVLCSKKKDTVFFDMDK